MEDANPPRIHGSCRFKSINASARRFAANEPHALLFYKVVETPHGIGSSTHTGDHRVGKPPLLLHKLRLDLSGNHRLEIPHNCGERVRAHHRAKAIVCIRNPGSPLPHRLGNRILQGGRPRLHRNHLRPQKPHTVHIQRLPDSIFLAHKHHALHAHQRRRRGRGYPVLPRSRLRNQSGFAHLLCKKGLPQHIVDFVGSCVV